MSFSELKMSPLIQRAIVELGFIEASPIQAKSLPILLGNQTDFIGLAATGTGKTAAFSIPLLDRIVPEERRVQGLVLCPTRELANQVAQQISLLGKYLGIRALPIYGGAGYEEQISGLRRGATVVVGTPGRLVDHIKKGYLKLDAVKTVVLDEADEMISMGFKEDLEEILSAVNKEESNTWLFSATMSPEVRKVAEAFLTEPELVRLNPKEMLSSTVEQFYYMTQESNKPEILCKLIDAADDFYGLVFCQTKNLVADLTVYLNERGYKVDCLHGDKDQKARERTMQSFRDRKVKILICTDVASRGLDVKDVTHVINYSLPRELENYVHRIGRTARCGKTGKAFSLVTPSHRRLIGQIENMTKSRMEEGTVPTRKELGSKKVSKIFPTFQAQENFKRVQEIMDPIWKEAIAGMSADEVAGRFLNMMFPEVFNDRAQDSGVRAEVEQRQPKTRTSDSYQDRRRPSRPERSASRGEYRQSADQGHRPDRYARNTDRPARRSESFERNTDHQERSIERRERSSSVSDQPRSFERPKRERSAEPVRSVESATQSPFARTNSRHDSKPERRHETGRVSAHSARATARATAPGAEFERPKRVRASRSDASEKAERFERPPVRKASRVQKESKDGGVKSPNRAARRAGMVRGQKSATHHA